MPKVLFSTLVSDMSGRSNGSVFSRNNSGSYFRNQPAKMKPQTAASSKRKASFTSISQAWKNLTEEQQDAWKAVVANFIRNNVFGVPVTPSGYNVFMRLNTARSTLNLPLLVLPPEPRTMPDPGEVTIDYPELFQFNPSYGTATYSQRDSNGNVMVTSDGYYSDTPISGGQLFAFRINAAQSITGSGVIAKPIRVFTALTGADLGVTVDLEAAGPTTFNVNLGIAVSGGTWEVTALLSNTLLLSDLHIAFFLDAVDGEDSIIYINGVEAAVTTSQTGTPVIVDMTAAVEFGLSSVDFQSHFVLSDFRYFETAPNAENVLLVSQGYVIGSETSIIGFEYQNGNIFPNATVGGSAFDFELAPANTGFRQLVPHSAMLIPQFSLNVENEGLEGVYFNIYATPPVSNGRTGAISNFKLLGTFPWEEDLSFPVANELAALFGNIPGNSQIVFKMEILDSTTGVISGPALKPPRKKPRFKAGAEISPVVN